MHDLTRQSLIDPLALDQRDLFSTLLTEALRCGLLTQPDLLRLQGESLALLAARCDRRLRLVDGQLREEA